MDFDESKMKIDRYLDKNNISPMLVDVQNHHDWNKIVSHYNVGSNMMIKASDYCKQDQLPRMDELYFDLENKPGNIFITGLSSFLKLLGEEELRNVLTEILSLTTIGHVVMITYQCKKYIDFKDPRVKSRIVVLEGERQSIPAIVFTTFGLTINKTQTVDGIESFAESVEGSTADKLYISTNKKKEDFPRSLYRIINLKKAYDVLKQKDPKTETLNENIGTDEQWQYALKLFEKKQSWIDVIDGEIGNHQMLDVYIQSYNQMSNNKKWLYYVGLKLFGAKNNWYLNEAISRSSGLNDLISNIYREILNIKIKNDDFWDYYKSRKNLLDQINNPSDELALYLKVLLVKEKNAIYYLTDNTEQEKEAIFEFLDQYGLEYTFEELMIILEKVYPDLFAYLQPYHFKNNLLNKYFQEYKYQKVINKILPNFEKLVMEQAEKRDYNRILEPRSSVLEKFNIKDSQLYFMDAMGVEYLGYIISKCKKLKLIVENIAVCRCELPSITSRNKEFIELWDEKKIVSIKDIDEIKHHGKYDYNYYSNSKLPLHLIKELEIIHNTLVKIRNKLMDGTIKSALMIADHGASRLAVLHDTENIWEMAEKGKHSGRCCPKSEIDVQPDYATDANDFWALANYDRFKGSRKANVEVHGGATLEEICIPIIELTYLEKKIEAHLLLPDAENDDFNDCIEIEVSFRKKAAVNIFISEDLPDVNIIVNGKTYDAILIKKGIYRVDMPDLRKKGTYVVDIYSGNNIIANNLTLIVKKEGQREKDLL